MPWIIGSAVLGSALIGSSAASSAAGAQAGATGASVDEQRRQFDIAQQNQAPWLEAGKTSLAELTGRLPELTRKFTLADFWADPVTQASYQSGLDLGTQALNRSAGARSSLNSGAQLKALSRFGTDYTGQQAGASQQRFLGDQTNTYNKLAGISGTGQTAATQTGNAAMATGSNIANLLTAQGNARGAAAIAQGNIWGGAAQNVGGWWQQQQMMNRLYPPGGGGWNPYQGYPGAGLAQPDFSAGYYG